MVVAGLGERGGRGGDLGPRGLGGRGVGYCGRGHRLSRDRGLQCGIRRRIRSGSPVAGSVPGADGPSPGTSGPPVSPADAVVSTGSIVTCAATDPSVDVH